MDINDIKNEIVVFLRNQDVISTSIRGVTTTTETFSGDDSNKTFTLSNDNVKNIRSVSVGGSSKSFGTDYSADYKATGTTVTFTTAPPTGTDNISIQYDYSATGDRIYPDFPKENLSFSSFPRIAVQMMGAESSPLGFGDGVLTSPVVTITAFSRKEYEVDNYIDDIRSVILSNRKNFYNFKYISPINMGPILTYISDKSDEILMRSADFRIYLMKE